MSKRSPVWVKLNLGQASPSIPHFALLNPGYARRQIRLRRRTHNTLEDYFNVFRLGMKGVYRHCGKKYLRCYVAEFDFCFNTRSALGLSAEKALQIIAGSV